MSTVAEKTLITPEEFLRMDHKGFELIDGELVERHAEAKEGRVSGLSWWVEGEIFGQLYIYCRGKELGWLFTADGGYQCFPDRPKTIRKPDVSFVKAGRMQWGQLAGGWLQVVPDLVVEVISPNDKAYEVDLKVEFFLEAGVPLIWVVYPNVRIVRIVRGDGSTATLREGDNLSGEEIIPGFTCPVSAIFPPRPVAPPAEATPEA